MKLEIKVKNPCAAVIFFDTLNPFMFNDNDLPRFIRENRQFLFMNVITGRPDFLTIDLPESVIFYPKEMKLCFEKESTDRMARWEHAVAGIPIPIIEYTLELETIRVDGIEYPESDKCRCPVIPPPSA